MKKYFLYLFLTSTLLLYGENLELWSESAILIDYETGEILYEKDIYKQLPPASMTKLVTIYKIFNEINLGSFTLETKVPVSSNADWRNLPRDSSLMFLEEGHSVTVGEIVKGLAISSGNDAAIAIAEFISGDMETFLYTINSDLKSMGFQGLYFTDSSGFSDDNTVNVYEFSKFVKILIESYPDSLQEVFSLKSFTYPKKSNGRGSLGPIKQYNRNKIISIYKGCDGLKTGFINKSGMNIALTAQRGKIRLIAVLIGAKDKNKIVAENKRLEDSIKILDYGFNNYSKLALNSLNLPQLKVNNIEISPYIPDSREILINKNYTISKYIINFNKDINNKQTDIGWVLIESGLNIYKFTIRHR